MQKALSTLPFALFRPLLCLMLLTLIGSVGYSQSGADNDHSEHRERTSVNQQNLASQLQGLQTKVAQLEALLKQKHSASMTSAMQPNSMKGMGNMKMGMGNGMSGMGMKSMSGMGGGGMKMGMMGQGMGGMSGMKMSGMGDMRMGGGMSGMNMMGKGMAMMGKMKGMGQMQMKTPSALPGFPGASHIYHIGSTAFFLDHPEHITLTVEQQTRLNEIRENSLLEQGASDLKIDETEQRLWVLTSSDSPEVMKIEKTVREIETLSGDQRIDFIRRVGEAAKVLTDDQRKSLIGTLPPDHSDEVDHQSH